MEDEPLFDSAEYLDWMREVLQVFPGTHLPAWERYPTRVRREADVEQLQFDFS